VHGCLDARNLGCAAAELRGERENIRVALLDPRSQLRLLNVGQFTLLRLWVLPLFGFFPSSR